MHTVESQDEVPGTAQAKKTQHEVQILEGKLIERTERTKSEVRAW